MVAFYILAFYIIIISLCKFKSKNKQLLVCLVPLFLFIATRIGWTSDYFAYEDMYDMQHDWTFVDYMFTMMDVKFEPGFFLLIKLCPSYRFLVVIVSACFIFAIFLIFKNYVPSKYLFVVFILWFFNPNFFSSISAMRSNIVISLLLLAVYAKINNKNPISICLVILSGFFHRSGFIFIPFFLISNDFLLKYWKLSFLGSILVIGVALFLPSFWTSTLKDVLEDSSMSGYTYYIEVNSFGLGYYLFTFMRISFILYIFYLIRRYEINDFQSYLLCFLIFYYVLASIPNLGLISRIITCIRPLFSVAMCNVLTIDRNRISSSAFIFINIAYMLLMEYTMFLGSEIHDKSYSVYQSSLFN